MTAPTLAACLTLALAQSPAPMIDPPTEGVTVARVRQVEAKVAEVNRLTDLLKKASQEINQQGNQDIEDYVGNAVFLLKTRAVLLVKLRVVCEEALHAKYALEATLDDYNLWLEAAQKASQQRDLDRERKVAELRKKADLVEQEFYIVADNLRRMLAQRQAKLSETENAKKENERELKQIDDRLARLASYFEALKQADFRPKTNADLEKKYGDLEADAYPELEKRLDALDQDFSDARFEADFIEKNVLGSTSNLINKLGTARKTQLEKAKKLLEESRKLETIASEVAIASRHVRQMLVEIDAPIDVANKGILIEAKLAVEQDVGKALREITGVERRSIWDRLAPTHPMTPEKPPTEK